MKLLSPVQFSYIAGIIDGEGYIGLTRYRKNYHFPWSYCAQCHVVNTNKDLLIWLYDSTRVGSIVPHSESKKPQHKPAYKWRLQTKEIIPFLEGVKPYLVIKGRQAEILIIYIRETRHDGRVLSDVEIERKLDLYHEITALNERGLY